MRWTSATHDRSEPRISTFQQQVDHLVTLGYPALTGRSEPDFRALLEPLRATADALSDSFVVVVTRDLVRPEDTVPLLRLTTNDVPGKVDRNHAEGDLATYQPIEESRPPGPAYLLVDVDPGREFLGVRPEEATRVVLARGRSPLTIDEGIALVTHRPELLAPNACFMLAGSRRGDRRVPALWIERGRVAERAPKLGWCWDGNPHSWLGLASAGGRTL